MAIRTGLVTVECVTIWCPECEGFIEGESGSSLMNEYEFNKLPKLIECPACTAKFRKPPNLFQKKRGMRRDNLEKVG